MWTIRVIAQAGGEKKNTRGEELKRPSTNRRKPLHVAAKKRKKIWKSCSKPKGRTKKRGKTKKEHRRSKMAPRSRVGKNEVYSVPKKKREKPMKIREKS